MPQIYYTANSYIAPYLPVNANIQTALNCSIWDLYRCMMTVGNPSYLTKADIRKYGFARAVSSSIIEKCLLIFNNIRSNVDLSLHPIFNGYVADKKRMVSYNLGMAVAKLYAEKLLDIPNLIHVESLKNQGAINFVNGQSKMEPDLVGKCKSGHWHVFEAKGTTRPQLNTKIIEAKAQAENVDTIFGTKPATLSACATYFGSNRIISKIVDPPSKDPEKEIMIDIEKFYQNYYSPYFALEEQQKENSKTIRINNEGYRVINLQLKSLNLELGIENEVYENLIDREYEKLERLYITRQSQYPSLNNIQENQTSSFGLDGFLVRAPTT